MVVDAGKREVALPRGLLRAPCATGSRSTDSVGVEIACECWTVGRRSASLARHGRAVAEAGSPLDAPGSACSSPSIDVDRERDDVRLGLESRTSSSRGSRSASS